ncbi:MAG: ABC transporter ATP-binding protein [Acholeplasmataceae bacterium]|nr:ABC transporter ATP-binding protein [Acholeplasmataceae bacterium]
MLFGKNVNQYYLKYALFFIVGILALVAVDIFQLEIPEIIGDVIDGIDENWLTKSILIEYMKKIGIIILVMFTGRFLWRICIFGNGVRIEAALREKMFVHLENLSQRYLQENKTGALMALFTNDLQTVRSAFAEGTLMLVDALFLGSMAFMKMWKLDITLTLISSIPLILLALCGKIIGGYMRKKYSQRQKAFANISDFTQESFSGISVIKAFVKEGKELLAFRKINQDNLEKNVEFVKAAVLLQILITFFISSIMIIILGYGGYMVYQSRAYGIGDFTIGTLTKFIQFFSTLTWPMMAVAQLINLTSQGSASLKRINSLLNEEPDIKDDVDAVDMEIEGKITFDAFTFSYPNAENSALKNISFTIEKGESLGIIGRTGSGKTILVDSLLRIYNVNQNQVFIDDVDIMKIKIADLRRAIAYVPQDNFLFSDTIANNINFSRSELNMDDIVAAAINADVHSNIQEFANGYETILGERGTTVSGGQKQRISIARALLSDAKILILDDSVSAVDTKTEETILHNIRNLRAGKTTIFIAHRISTIQSLDKIALLEEGKLIGFGSHLELMHKCPTYKKMVDLQRLEDEVGGVKNE